MEHDAWFFIGIFVFIFLIWIATGGPLRTPAVTVPAVPNLTANASGTISGSNSYIQLPRSPYGIGGDTVCLPGSTSCPNSYSYGSSGSSGTPGTTGPSSGTVPSGVTGVTLTPPSPYRNQVTMRNYVSSASSSDPKSEYVQIYLAQNASAAVDITNWVLKSGATGKAEVIPKGTAVPTSGAVNAANDIILQPGDSAIIVSGESPVGASFRENKCIGYFNGFQQFTPSLPQNCPSASDELTALYGTPYIHDPACIDYTKSLSRCQTAVTKTASLTLTCQDFLENHLNYNSCLSLHRGDSDFTGTVWHIYLGRKSLQDATRASPFNTDSTNAGPLWRAKYEVVELLDERGKTVATFNY
jgi:hypothetical protein